MMSKAKLAAGTAMGTLMLATGTPATAQTTAPSTATPTATTTAKPLKPVYRNIRGFYRNIRGFWGEVNPFYRNIRGFWGDVDPFYRNIRGFWGTMDPTAMASAAGAPVHANVGQFWDSLGTTWTGISDQWSTVGAYDASTQATYASVATQMQSMVGTSKTFWGAAVTKKTGKTFEAGFSDAFLASYGLNLADPTSFAKLPVEDRGAFLLGWYDGLMAFSGTDHADHWMKSVNWTPRLTQIQGSGDKAVIGLIDQFSASDADTKAKLIYAGGNAFLPTDVEGAIHGAGVLSLINASHDGKGVMGIAPNARVAAYNPFDAQGGADWAGVKEGIKQVGAERTVNGVKMRASVINLSLGAPGTTFAKEWRDVFKTSTASDLKDKVVYVIAAGNDGHTQTTNINMKDTFDSTYIVVGSVDPTGKISDFSNRPGTACVLEDRDCKNTLVWNGRDKFAKTDYLKESGLLMNRFITAPGELILVSDGKGGVTRQSGTSLAAPLVSGAIALIQDRWPWFKEKPRDIAEMILGSARDAGAPGIDPVYGVGILDVEAAQAPLNFDTMKFYLYSTAGKETGEVKVGTLENTGVQSTWTTKNMYFTAFEKVIDAERDFLIPLSSTLYGATRGGEYFQDFVYNRMQAWIAAPGFTADGRRGFSDLSNTGGIPQANGWSMAMTGRVVQGYTDGGGRRTILNTAVKMTAPENRFSLSLGHGDGAAALGGGRNLGLTSDFDPYSGGVNPLLGFASGGAHMGASMLVVPNVQFKAGYTRQTRSLGLDIYQVSAADRSKLAGMDRYSAEATNIGLDYQPARWVTLSASATRLVEPNAFLGVRTTAGNAFGEGTVSTGVTVGADADIGSGVNLFGSATASSSSSSDKDAALRIDGGYGTAFQAGVAKHGLLGKSDSLRFSVAKPLGLSGGSIEVTQRQVIDRETGEQGYVTERFSLNSTKRLVAEGMYGAPILDGRGQVSLFGRGELLDVDAGTPRLMAGGQFKLSF